MVDVKEETTNSKEDINMRTVQIKLNEINDVYTLVNTLVSYDGDVDLESGRYKVDGKSLLGIFSLDLRQPITMTIHDEKNADELLAKIDSFVVKA
jgi:phosphotransferase system HPr-like phosphotransfer protein